MKKENESANDLYAIVNDQLKLDECHVLYNMAMTSNEIITALKHKGLLEDYNNGHINITTLIRSV